MTSASQSGGRLQESHAATARSTAATPPAASNTERSVFPGHSRAVEKASKATPVASVSGPKRSLVANSAPQRQYRLPLLAA